MRLAIGLLIIASVLGGCNYINKKFGLPDDNMIEEMVEQKIQDQVGIDIDLTPNSKE